MSTIKDYQLVAEEMCCQYKKEQNVLVLIDGLYLSL
jgi:hypothetical protein